MPRVVMVEEAGECLDSHTLATLPASVQHLILCGDHLQLRPSVSCFDLSADSKTGKLYKLDGSLFERLVTARLPSSLLEIQRRMGP